MTSPARVERDEIPRASWAASLGETPVLRHLDPGEIRRLIDDGAVEAFADGAEVIRAGAPTSAVYFLVEGECDVHRADRTVRLTAPAMAGEIAALTGTLRTATVRAAGAVRTVVVPGERFLEAIRTSAAAGQALTELVADRICAPDSIRQVGRFTIEGIVGSGGSGRVLRARHPLLEIPIALKMLSHALALMPGAPRTFIREASLLAQLDHPGIVRVLDAFEALGTFFIVMPWIEGATLRERIDRPSTGARAAPSEAEGRGATFTAEEIRRIAAEALDALTTVHAAGLVHRDIKPSNLFVRSSGRVVLIDFGIAVAAPGATAPSPESRASSPAPRAPRLAGTPAYSSPEQILGRAVDGRSDVYSLACTLYELVFGRAPFGSDDVERAIDGHVHGAATFDVPPVVRMDDAFLQWLRTCLSRTRARRPDAVAALAALS